MKDLQKILEPFRLTFGKLQDLLTLLGEVKNAGFELNNLINYLEEVKQIQLGQDKLKQDNQKQALSYWNKLALKCPNCATKMHLFPVNTQPGDQTGDASNSQWLCSKCLETIYNKETVKEILKERSY